MTEQQTDKATPRPWYHQEGFDNVYAVNSGLTTHIATFSHHQLDGGQQEAVANAKLTIAAVNAYDPAREEKINALVTAVKEARELLSELAHPGDANRSVSSQVYWARCVASEANLRTALEAMEKAG